MPVVKNHPYRGMWAAIATMHNKVCGIAPPLCRWFGMTITNAPGIDTDALGTFTGERCGTGMMIEAARQKAKWAIARTGAPLGIGSAGAFGPDPDMPLVGAGREVLLLRESASGHEIVVQVRSRANFAHTAVRDADELGGFLDRVGFPAHALIVRAEEPCDSGFLATGLQDLRSVAKAIRAGAGMTRAGAVVVETDKRAHVNPTRMASIRSCARWLALRIARCCPHCNKPGFGMVDVDVEVGLRCRTCGIPADAVSAEINGCTACGHRSIGKVRSDRVHSQPLWCNHCDT